MHFRERRVSGLRQYRRLPGPLQWPLPDLLFLRGSAVLFVIGKGRESMIIAMPQSVSSACFFRCEYASGTYITIMDVFVELNISYCSSSRDNDRFIH